MAVLGPGQGGPGPPVFLGTNYDALSAFVVDDKVRRSCLVFWLHLTIRNLFLIDCVPRYTGLLKVCTDTANCICKC